jgi:hypothetical protein
MKESTDEFMVEYNNEIVYQQDAFVVSSIATLESQRKALNSVLEMFKNWIHIKSTKALKCLPEHTTYD